MYISNIVTSLLNAHRVLKISKTKVNLDMWVIKPLISVVSASIACNIISDYIIIQNSILDIVFKLGIIGGVYVVLLFLFGVLEKDSITFLKK